MRRPIFKRSKREWTLSRHRMWFWRPCDSGCGDEILREPMWYKPRETRYAPEGASRYYWRCMECHDTCVGV